MNTCLVVDTETLGMAPPAALIELGWCSVRWSPDQPPTVGETTGQELFGIPEGQTMAPDNRAVHHIDPASLEGLAVWNPSFVQDVFMAAPAPMIDYLVAHNSEFEEQWLGTAQPWICTYKVALRAIPDAPSHSNGALKYLLGVRDRPEHHPPHRALPDAIVTAEILVMLVDMARKRRPEWSIQQVLASFAEITQEPRRLPTCPIGKFRGRPWSEVETGFLSWMLRQPDMERDLRLCADRELTRRRPQS